MGLDAALSGSFSIGGDLDVNRHGFGAMRITGQGIWGSPLDRDEALAVLRRAVELGIDLIDTADSYGPAVSEELIAEALAPYPQGLVVATKGGYTRPGPDRWEPDIRPEHLRAACEGSLRRLRLERIDLYQLHNTGVHHRTGGTSPVTYEDAVGTLKELQDEGKIKQIGVSNVDLDHLERARRIAAIVTVQNRYSVGDRGSEDVLEYCERHGIGFFPWRPLGGGSVEHAALDAVAQRHGATPLQVAIAWLLARSPVMLPIPGTSSVEHLEENVAAAALRLEPEDLAQLDGVAEA